MPSVESTIADLSTYATAAGCVDRRSVARACWSTQTSSAWSRRICPTFARRVSASEGDLGFDLVRDYIGDVLLRIEVPFAFPGLYVADYAHMLECKHVSRRGTPALKLGYRCTTGHEVTQAYVHSYVPAATYVGGHVCPVV